MKQVRGHHLFCMTLFSGHGYDGRFAENMGRLIGGFQAGEELQLCGGQDAICGACPNRETGGGCALGTEDVQRRDTVAQKVLGVGPGQVLSWDDAMEKLRTLTGPQFQAVCGGCRWAAEGLCSFELLCKRAGKGQVKPEDT